MKALRIREFGPPEVLVARFARLRVANLPGKEHRHVLHDHHGRPKVQGDGRDYRNQQVSFVPRAGVWVLA